MQTIRHKRISTLGIAIVAIACVLSLLSIQSAAAQAPATLTLTVPDATVSEDAGTVTVTATLDQPAPAGGVRVALTSRPIAGRASPGYDFALPAAFTIAEDQTAATADITILDNNTVEPDKPIVLNAAVNVQGITVKGVTFTLSDDDFPVLTGLYVHPDSNVGVDDNPNDFPITPLTPRFSESPLVFEYSARVNPDVPAVTIRATGASRGIVKIGLKGSLADTRLTSWIHRLSQPITLSDGENVIEVQWTLHGKTSTYTVKVTRGLLPAPAFSVTREARNGQPAIMVTLAEQPLNIHEMRVQVRESTSDPWPDATESDLLPDGAGTNGFSWTFKSTLVTGLAKGTTYEVRAHLIELSGPPADLTRAVASQSSDEVQVTTLSPAPAPTGLTLTPTKPGSGFNRAIRVSWDAVEDGSPSLWYRVRWREADQTPEAAWSRPRQTSGTRYSVSLSEDGTYDVQVASDNGVNPIAWSEAKQATVNHAGGV